MKKKLVAMLMICGLVIALIPAAAVWAETKDVYIDNTVDNSKSYVTGEVHLTGSGGEQAGYSEGKTVYSYEAAVTYSNPRTSEVQGSIDDAYTKVYKIAKSIKDRAKDGEFQMATSETTGEVWDNRKYTTIEDGDAVLIGDSDYLSGAYGVDNPDYTRTHIASGDYGKETFYKLEANGWVSGFDITVSNDGNGTATSDLAVSLAEETVTVTAAANAGFSFKEWQVIAGGAVIEGATSANATFTMPKADVEIKAVFEPDHEHSLSKTDKVDPTCEKDGSEAYWTCSTCGKMFSDEDGINEITEPVVIPATGHDWGEWTVTKEADINVAGEEERICKNDPEHIEIREIPAIVISYREVSGAGGVYTKESTGSLEFTFKRSVEDSETIKHFSGIKVDDSDVDASDYTAVSGSVVITLKDSYLEKLSAGEHTLTVLFDDGDAVKTTFTIKEKEAAVPANNTPDKTSQAEPAKPAAPAKDSKSPHTGDDSNILVWAAILAASLLGGAFVIVRRRRKN